MAERKANDTTKLAELLIINAGELSTADIRDYYTDKAAFEELWTEKIRIAEEKAEEIRALGIEVDLNVITWEDTVQTTMPQIYAKYFLPVKTKSTAAQKISESADNLYERISKEAAPDPSSIKTAVRKPKPKPKPAKEENIGITDLADIAEIAELENIDDIEDENVISVLEPGGDIAEGIYTLPVPGTSDRIATIRVEPGAEDRMRYIVMYGSGMAEMSPQTYNSALAYIDNVENGRKVSTNGGTISAKIRYDAEPMIKDDILQCDMSFYSPSGATSFIAGRPDNGITSFLRAILYEELCDDRTQSPNRYCDVAAYVNFESYLNKNYPNIYLKRGGTFTTAVAGEPTNKLFGFYPLKDRVVVWFYDDIEDFEDSYEMLESGAGRNHWVAQAKTKLTIDGTDESCFIFDYYLDQIYTTQM